MSAIDFNNGKACFYEIKEHTRGERASAFDDGNIGRWSYINNEEQKFLIIPLENDRFNIVSLKDGRYWTVQDYAVNASIELQPARIPDGDSIVNPDNDFQRFQLVLRNSNIQDEVYNIVEFTRNEYVAVSEGWLDNGNFIRWGGSSNHKSRLFSFIQKCKTPPKNIPVIQKLSKPPQLQDFTPPTINATAPVTIEVEVLPFYLVDKHFDINTRNLQFQSCPYYFLRREVYWKLCDNELYPGYIEYDGVSHNKKYKFEITKGFSKQEKEEIKTYFSKKTTIGGKFKLLGKIEELKLEAEGNIKFENTSGEETINSTIIADSRGRKALMEIEFKPGFKTAHAYWQRIEILSLLDPNKPVDSPIAEWELKTNLIDIESKYEKVSSSD
ncbi:MAG: hypothetical protein AAF378_21805 [Cyanobacteria bacterium P01_A01_bin.84]